MGFAVRILGIKFRTFKKEPVFCTYFFFFCAHLRNTLCVNNANKRTLNASAPPQPGTQAGRGSDVTPPPSALTQLGRASRAHRPSPHHITGHHTIIDAHPGGAGAPGDPPNLRTTYGHNSPPRSVPRCGSQPIHPLGPMPTHLTGAEASNLDWGPRTFALSPIKVSYADYYPMRLKTFLDKHEMYFDPTLWDKDQIEYTASWKIDCLLPQVRLDLLLYLAFEGT